MALALMWIWRRYYFPLIFKITSMHFVKSRQVLPVVVTFVLLWICLKFSLNAVPWDWCLPLHLNQFSALFRQCYHLIVHHMYLICLDLNVFEFSSSMVCLFCLENKTWDDPKFALYILHGIVSVISILEEYQSPIIQSYANCLLHRISY